MISKTNLIDMYIEKELKQVPYNKLTDYRKLIDYMSYAGVKSRGVNGILRFKQAIDHVTNSKNLYFSNEESNRTNAIYQAFHPIFQLDIFKTSVEYTMITKGLINLHNPEEVKKINDVYFTEYPLDLNVL